MQGACPPNPNARHASASRSLFIETLEERLTPTTSPLQSLLAVQPKVVIDATTSTSLSQGLIAGPNDLVATATTTKTTTPVKTQSAAIVTWAGWEDFGTAPVAKQVAANADGRLEVFAITADGTLLHRWQVKPNGGWSGWESLGSGFKTLDIATNSDGRLEVFALGKDGALYQRWQSVANGGWNNSWLKTAGNYKSVDAIDNIDGRLQAFLIGSDGAIQTRAQVVANGSWGNNTRWDGSFQSVKAERDADGRLDVFALGTDGVINQRWQNTVNGTWSSWQKWAGTYKDFGVIDNADGRLELFALGTDSSLYQRWQLSPNSAWGSIQKLGGSYNEIDLTRSSDGRLQLYAVSSAGRLSMRAQNNPGSAWTAWTDIGSARGDVIIGQNLDGRFEVFATSASGRMIHTWQNVTTLAKDYNSAWNIDSIKAQEVWNAGYSGQGIIVAVLDTGVQLTHPDLVDNVWTNFGEIPKNGIDDDKNGYVDDTNGWDFVNLDNNPADANGHGTFVAGEIAAESNGFGVTGVAPNVTVMPLQVLNNGGTGSSNDLARAIRYAVDNGARIINISIGGSEDNSLMTDAIGYAQSKGVFIVAASGNDSAKTPTYPAIYSKTFTNLISVGAYDSSGNALGTANKVGTSKAVQIDAPGVDIYSTSPSNTYRFMSGTSMAAPEVSAVAALLLSAKPNLRPDQIRSILTLTATRKITGSDSIGALNAKAALDLALSGRYG